MRRSSLILTALVATTPGLASADSTYGNYSLGRFNVIVSGTMTGTNGDVEGATIVGGNLASSGVNYAIKVPQPSTSTDTLVVGGNITGSNTITVDSGVTRYGGTSANVHDNSNAAPIHDATTQGLGASLNGYLTGVSNGFFNLASTNTAANPTSSIVGGSGLTDQNGTLTFNVVANSRGVAVLDISSALFNGGTYKGHGFEYNVVGNGNALKEIVFNVSGTSADLNINSGFGNSFRNSGLNAATIFNFYQATTITTEGNFGYFQGALLAPNATFTNNADDQGSIYVSNFVERSEVHLPSGDDTSNLQGFAGPLYTVTSAAVPEPAALLSTLTGLAIAGLIGRRISRRGHARGACRTVAGG